MNRFDEALKNYNDLQKIGVIKSSTHGISKRKKLKPFIENIINEWLCPEKYNMLGEYADMIKELIQVV